MRPEVRARHARAVARIGGEDEAFLTRLERFFTELHDPLHALYGEDERFPAAWDALIDLIAATATERDPELRRLDHEREITPDWLHREQAVGYMAYVDRFAGTLRGVRERLPYLLELGVSYLHLMPLLRTRPEPNDGGYAVAGYDEVEPALGTMEDLRELAAETRAAGVALCVDVVLNHTAREHPWAVAARRATRAARVLPDLPRPVGARRLRAHDPGRLPRHRAGQLHLGRGARPLGVDDVPLLPVGPRPHQPRGLRRDGRGDAGADRRRRRRAAAGRRPLPLEAPRHRTARTSPRSTSSCRRTGRRADRGARRGVQGRGDRGAARPRRVPRRRPARGHGVRPGLPQRAHGPAVEHARVRARRAAGRDAAGDAPDPADRGVAHVRALPRRHRLGDHRRGRRQRREDARPHRRFLSDFYTGGFPGSFARGARFQPPADGEARISGTAASLAGLDAALERRDELDAELAVRRLLRALRRRVRASRASGDLDGRRARAAQRPRLGGGAGARPTTTAGCIARGWTGTPRHAGTGAAPPEGRAWAGLRGSSTRGARSGRCTATASRGQSRPATSTCSAWCREHAGDRLLLLASFSEHRRPVSLSLLAEHGVVLDARAAEPDGRPLRTDGGLLVLEPYQHVWFRAAA